MKKYLYLMALLVAIAPSCKQADSPISSVEEQAQLPKHNVNINLSGTFSNSEGDVLRAYMTPTDKDEIKLTFDESELMKDGDIDPTTGKPKRVKNTNTGMLTLYFVEASNPTNVITKTVDPTDFRQNADKSYTIEFVGSVELTGVDVTTGNWYVSGGYRLQSTENGSSKPFALLHLDKDGRIQYNNGTVVDFKLPFVFGWSKLVTKETQPKLANNHAQQFDLRFKPDGYFLRVRAINNLVEDIKLGVLYLYSEGLSLGGRQAAGYTYTYPSTDNLAAGNTPHITSPNAIAHTPFAVFPTDEKTAVGWGDGRVLSPGGYFTAFVPFSSATTPKTVGKNFMSFQFGTIAFPQGQTAGGAALEGRELAEMPQPSATEFYQGNKLYLSDPIGYITDMWRGASQQDKTGWNGGAESHTKNYRKKYLPENTEFKLGRVHNINFKLNSDLMITELYTSQYSARNGSFGLIEIYNPTLDPIDLSKYALVRFGYRNDGSKFVVRNLPNAVEINADGTVGSKLCDVIDKALVLPLDLRDGNPSGTWTVNSFDRPMRQSRLDKSQNQYIYKTGMNYTANAGSGVSYSNFAAKVVDFSTKGLIKGLKAIQPGATVIQPGKTMIVLFSGYAADGYQPNEEDKAIFSKIEKAAAAGYCDHVVAISQGLATAQPHEAAAGVTTADIGDGFSLVRTANYFNNAPLEETQGDYNSRVTTRIFVDGTWNSLSFDGGGIIKGLINTGATALIRRPYGPYLWNTGFQAPDDPSRYYQKSYSIDKATFGAPYFSSYDPGKTWNEVVQPRIDQRNANLFKKATK